jgi:predicted transposase/invertase (TIGR01784 family)
MEYDNVCKLLCKRFPKQYAAWKIKNIAEPVTVLEQELSIEPIRADSVIFLQTPERILHMEFQVNIENSNPPLPLRMLDYWVRLYRQYRRPVDQIVVLLKESPAAKALESTFQFENTNHSYQVVRMWEEDTEWLIQDKALFPLAVLSHTSNSKDLLNQVAERVKTIDNIDERKLISSCTQILAGLRYEAELIHQIFKEGMMRESVIYQEILQEGLQEGLQKGLHAGRLEGRQKGLQEGQIAFILRQLQKKFGMSEPELREQLQHLPVNQLEELAEAILDFNNSIDVKAWIQKRCS